jgi:hypothetical protein
MIYFQNNEAQFYTTKAIFTDTGRPVEQYTNDRQYYESLVGQWGHLSNLSFEDVVPTQSQQARLVELNNLEVPNKDLWQGTCATFVEHGIILPDDSSPLSSLEPSYRESTLNFFREERRQILKQERDERISLPINNVQVGRIEDRENVTGTISNWDILGLTTSIRWVMADNTLQDLSKADLEAVVIGYTQRKAQVFSAYQQAVMALQQASTIEEIMNVMLQGAV